MRVLLALLALLVVLQVPAAQAAPEAAVWHGPDRHSAAPHRSPAPASAADSLSLPQLPAATAPPVPAAFGPPSARAMMGGVLLAEGVDHPPR